MADPIALARDLIRCPSVTPAEGGALALIETVLKGAGFEVHRVTFAEPGTDPIDNLYARIGSAAPHLMLAGHTDVVPPATRAGGPPAVRRRDRRWRALWPRGGRHEGQHRMPSLPPRSIISAATAASRTARSRFSSPATKKASPSTATVKLLSWAAERGETFDHCILGEPTNPQKLGDMIKIGGAARRMARSSSPARRGTWRIRNLPTIRCAASRI
jgi:succinyl-diaminopimelate desuccinylase